MTGPAELAPAVVGGAAPSREMPPAIVVSGPTATGKSAVAEEVALALGCGVISADAMQVYRGMDIGTAKLAPHERRVPLSLVDLIEPTEAYSAALYQRDCRAELERVAARGERAVLCGGTGLYLRAALDDLRFPAGELTDERRRRYQALAREEGPAALHALLAERDPASAQVIHPNNVKRVIRALEMHDEGVSYAEQAAGFSAPQAFYPHLDFALTMDRARLYERIDARVDRMFAEGLVAEVEGLVAAGAREALTSRQAIGYKEVIQMLDGELAPEEAAALIKQRTRRYAKRQLSWWRRDARTIWVDMDELDVHGAAAFILERAGR